MKDQNELAALDSNELAEQLLKENDISKLNNIIDLINTSIKKKDIIRTITLSEVQDIISNQMAERVSKRSDEFSNKDLLDYWKAIQENINKANDHVEAIKAPIQINQQNINIAGESLNKDSRDRVAEVVKSILADAKDNFGSTSNLESSFTIIDEDDLEDENLGDDIEDESNIN